MISWALCAQGFHAFYVLIQPQFSTLVCHWELCLPHPLSLYSAWRSPWFQRDAGSRGWLWLQENHFQSGCGMSELTLPSPLHSLHSAAASLFSLGAWPRLSPISSVFSSLPTCASYSLSLFRMQMADGFSFLASSSSHRSLSAIQPLKLGSLNYLNFLKLKTLLLFCLNWVNLWKIGLNWVITSSFYYSILTICQKSPAESPPICSVPVLFWGLLALTSGIYRAPVLVFVLLSISGI